VQALATPSRLRILARLHAGPASVSEIAQSVGMEGSAVSHQLRLLRHLGLVLGERDGRQVVYELYDDHVAELLDQVVSHVEHVRLGLAGRA
jgi:ArsR family transcriptional regulator